MGQDVISVSVLKWLIRQIPLNFPNKTESDNLRTLIQPIGKISQVLIYYPSVVNKILANEDWGVRDTAKIKY